MAVLVVAGAGLAVATPVHAATTGIDGTIVDSVTGQPVAGVRVQATPRGIGNYGFATTDANGHYAMPNLVPGTYAIEARKLGYITQFAFGKEFFGEADLVTAPGVADFRLVAETFGAVKGRLLRHNGTAGIAGASVYVYGARGLNIKGFATTDANGYYVIPKVVVGKVKVTFELPNGEKLWAHGRKDYFDADVFTLATDQTITVDEVAPPYGDVAITVTDPAGKPVADSVAYLEDGPSVARSELADTKGVIRFTDLPLGEYKFTIVAGNKYVLMSIYHQPVAEDTTTKVTVALALATTLRFKVADAATGAVVTKYCIYYLTPSLHGPVSSDCVDSDQGYFDLGGIAPDRYRFFIYPRDGVHGSQWVGPKGGTGDQDAAKVFDAKAGPSGTVTVKLDKAGTITGSLKDKATGKPTAGCASLLGFGPDHSYLPDDLECEPDGRYTLNHVGPYTWKLAFSNPDGPHAWQWSGGAGSRDEAVGVKVRAGGTASPVDSLRAAGAVSGKVTLRGGGDPRNVLITAVDADTGDYVGQETHPAADGTFTLSGLTNQSFWLYFAPSQPDRTIRSPQAYRTDYGRTLTGVTITL
jgi:hypothetical protein